YSVFAVIGLAVAMFLILSGAKQSRRVHNNSEVS
ncbi:hypothetical protein Lpp126_00015, partial [Lacticaseibacillus paracasei subsp. paracasei Lpp126]